MTRGHILRAFRMARSSPWDFTIQYPPRREYFQENFRASDEAEFDPTIAFGDGVPLLLYLHIPFCAQRCSYCNFAVDLGGTESRMASYAQALEDQLERAFDAGLGRTDIRGIDIGGGTPTLLTTDQLTSLRGRLAPVLPRSRPANFVSIETTPESAAGDPHKLSQLVRSGVGRLSMGIQTTDADRLSGLGRPRLESSLLERAVDNARNGGFQRINTDLIFGLPDQTLESWASDLDGVLRLRPDSITTYDCLYRGKGRRLTRQSPERPTSERMGVLYDHAWTTLQAAGYRAPYGSVNFTLHADETGTSAYFEGRLLDGLPYLGLGNYATSWMGRRWTFAERSLSRWTRRAQDSWAAGDDYLLPVEEAMAKQLLLMLSFGFLDGQRFELRFGEPLEERFGTRLRIAVEEGILEREGLTWSLVPGRFGQLPLLRALLYSERSLAWLEALGPLSDGRAGRARPRSTRPLLHPAQPGP